MSFSVVCVWYVYVYVSGVYGSVQLGGFEGRSWLESLSETAMTALRVRHSEQWEVQRAGAAEESQRERERELSNEGSNA
jgi:hypothetical protein